MSEDPVAARIAEMRERNEAHIAAMMFTEYTVSTHPCGDLRRALAALDAVLAALEVGSGSTIWQNGYRECATRVRDAISAELLGETGEPGD